MKPRKEYIELKSVKDNSMCLEPNEVKEDVSSQWHYH